MPNLASPGNFAHDAADSELSRGKKPCPPRQPDLFGHNGQHELFGEDAPTLGRADPDAVRQELYKILAEARAAQTMPLGP